MSDIKPENIILVSEFAPAIGLSATAAKTEVLSRLGILAALSAIVTIKDGKIQKLAACELKDGALPLPDLAPMDGRLKKIEEAGTKQIATLSATIDGKVQTFTGEDVVKLAARLDKMEKDLKDGVTSAETRERETLVSRFSAEGKAPINPVTAKSFSAEELNKLTNGELKMLLANTPATVPLNARTKVGAEQKPGAELKGLAKAIAVHAAERQ